MQHRAPLSHALAPYSPEIAHCFEDVPTPPPLDDATGRSQNIVATGIPDLGGSLTRAVVLVGSGAMQEVDAVHALVARLGALVANTWGTKGIYPWDDPHHMGTCGLQRDDFALLGFAEFELIIAIGVDPHETPEHRYALATTITLPASREYLARACAYISQRRFRPQSNELYTRVAAIAQPGYIDDSFPRHPARAVMDLKQSLGPSARVTAQPGLAGLWIARTFPTDRMGSVIVPAYDRPGIGAAVGVVSAAQGTDTVCVVQGPVDDITRDLMDVAARRELPLRLEVWEDDVDWSRTEDLIAAAGPVVAWT